MSTRAIPAEGRLPTALGVPASQTDRVDRAHLATGYSLRTRLIWTLAAMVVAILIAGLWNARAVDGFGRDVVAREHRA
jgi:hypothetical protein